MELIYKNLKIQTTTISHPMIKLIQSLRGKCLQIIFQAVIKNQLIKIIQLRIH